jgi:peptide/nickel transport system ATP-binding protein
VTSALDASVQAVVVELLRDLQLRRGLSVVFITHNLALVRSIAKTVVVLHDGAVVERGEVFEVMEHPATAYTAQLIEDAARFAAEGEPAAPPAHHHRDRGAAEWNHPV